MLKKNNLIMIISALILLVGIPTIYYFNNDENNNTEIDTIKNENKSFNVKVGQSFQIGDIGFLVKSIEVLPLIKGDMDIYDITPTNTNYEFIVVDVSVTNKGIKKFPMDNALFKIKNNGISYEPKTIWEGNDLLALINDKDTINANSTISGRLIFEVPKGLTDADLQIQAGLWGTKTALLKMN